MSSGKRVCVNCKYEEATKSITEMWKAEELGIDPGELPARRIGFVNNILT